MRAPAIVLLLAPLALLGQQAAKNSCLDCHSALDGAAQRPSLLSKTDVHTVNGLGCADCHGGDRTSDDPSVAMNPAKGFIGKPARTAIPKLCARCHSDPDFMRKFRPQQRVDQYELYQTSIHGKRLASGDYTVATCIDCHSVHDIRQVKDALAPVHPLRLPETCGRCHADSQKMAKYGIPTNQLADYRTSVHWNALKIRGDLSAPNCASCHGNHGAKPPQVESVAAVCGSCHVPFGQLYQKSVHEPIFSAASGGGGCIVCHSNHAIHQPSTAMLEGPNAVCSRCHDPGTPGANAAAQMATWIDGLDSSLKQSEAVLTSAEKYGMEVSDAQARIGDGRENLVKARLALHSMQLSEVKKPVDAGMAIANETLRAGQAALREKDFRRWGLAVSVLLIGIAIFAIWLLIRRIEIKGGHWRDAGAPVPK
ncbi:MAG TPA: cytochrome c3 family protein [Bryobacteraceae bacterium]|nr:cytochrome c3 family protein [Bryobacteraceae bacterium]